MKSNVYLSLALASTLVLTSCKKLGELSADNFTVTPSPMEAVSGQVPVTIDGRFPEKYMKKKAVVTVIPVLRYEGGEAKGQSATFQGEKVKGNDQEISYKMGGNYTMRNSFEYVPAMQKSELYLTFEARVGKKEVEVPEVKVADGVIATSALVGRTAANANGALGEDAYQYSIAQTKKAQIKYLINQAKVRSSELETVSVQEFVQMLRDIKADQKFVQMLRDIKADQKGLQLDGIEVSAYASPDGAFDFNKQLAEKREGTSTDYLKGELKKIDLDADIDGKYTAEDWDGFKELVEQSNLQDKDVILRVLSMYQDPEERETQIRNISAAYKELADEILPELRRARLTLSYNVIGRTDDEIQAQYKSDASKLSVEEMLYAATLTNDPAEQTDIYTKTTQQYPSDYRAYNNLAILAMQKGDLAAAKNYLDQAASKKGDAAEVNANRALLALAQGNVTEAENYAGRATTAKNYKEVVGNLNIAKGNYAQAANDLSGVNTNSAALAQILNKDYTAAASTLTNVAKPDAMTSYLKAIVNARTNQTSTALTNLREAIQKDASLKAYAAKDLEFAALFNDATFQSLVK